MLTQVDCDIHVTCTGTVPLLPYLNDHWRDIVNLRGIDRMELASYPARAPYCSRADWRDSDGLPGGDQKAIGKMLTAFGTDLAIVNCLHGAQALFSEDLGAALCTAVNDWLAAEWLDRDERLRASVVVHAMNPALAVEEIERRAVDKRFVQVLLMAGSHNLLGHRTNWPIFEAAERHGFAIGIHAGSLNHHAPSPVGWPQTFAEDNANQSLNCQQQVLSMISEGVFTKFPDLKLVVMESGISWIPSFMWRANKTWQGLRMEAPWVKEKPADIFRRHVRVTAQPFDCPAETSIIEKLVEQMGSDEVLLFATDYPHWHFEGEDPLPVALADGVVAKMKNDNAFQTYNRLSGGVQ